MPSKGDFTAEIMLIFTRNLIKEKRGKDNSGQPHQNIAIR